jgi:hypothetical protein
VSADSPGAPDPQALEDLGAAWTEYRRQRVDIARHDPSTFIEYVMRDEETGERLVQLPHHERWQVRASQHARFVLWAFPESGKALPLDTPIPTPGGWTALGELGVGDEVFDRHGRTCRVTFATPTMLDRELYRLEFDDGASICADADHLWVARSATDRVLRRGRERVVSTKQMAKGRWMIPTAGSARWRNVMSIRRIATRPVRCIGVSSPDQTYLAGRDYVVTHNSSQLTVGRTLMRIGQDPTIRVAIIGATEKQAKKPLGVIKGMIERSHELREIFPRLRPGSKWTDNEITVARPLTSRDPTVQALGLHGAVQGSRIDLLILDDILDADNTRTAAQREAVSAWVRATLFSRLTRRSQVLLLTNAWHPDDLAHELEKDGWAAERCAIEDEEGRIVDPGRWSPERLAEKRVDFGDLEYARQMELRPYDEEARRFNHTWLDACLRRGDGVPVYAELADELPDDSFVVHGVDLGVGQLARNDVSVIFSLFIHPNDDRQVLRVRAGRWKASQILNNLKGTYDDLGGMFMVENNAAQDFIVQLAREMDVVIPVRAFTTGRNKVDPAFGVESLAAEFEAERWIIPNQGARCFADTVRGDCDDEVREWLRELLQYDPRSHTGDHLMASWFARELARMVRRKLRRRERRRRVDAPPNGNGHSDGSGEARVAAGLAEMALRVGAN